MQKWKNNLDSKVSFSDGSPVPCVLLANKVYEVWVGGGAVGGGGIGELIRVALKNDLYSKFSKGSESSAVCVAGEKGKWRGSWWFLRNGRVFFRMEE